MSKIQERGSTHVYHVSKISKEEIVIMTILCNGMQFDVCINRADLGGEPEAGRRFKGIIWLQGRVNFTVRSTARSGSTYPG